VARRSRVLIYAPLNPEESGGVAQYIRGLASALRDHSPADLDLIWVVRSNGSGWLSDVLDSRWDVLEIPAPVGYLQSRPTRSVFPRVHLVHFPYQVGFFAACPYVYQPHDLQHLHFPENFSLDELQRREEIHALARGSSRIIVSSDFTAKDIESRLSISADRIDVVRYGPPPVVNVPAAAPTTFVAPSKYILYPAGNWPHKNHLRLLEALRYLRSQGLHVPIVLPGSHSGSADLSQLVAKLELSDLVTLPGFVDESVLRWLYTHSEFVIVPSLFESGSFPLFEAMRLGVPVASSNVTSLPSQVLGGGLIFDPWNVESIARAIRILWMNPVVREHLVEHASDVIESWTWEVYVQQVLKSYRRCLGRHRS